MKHPIYLSIIFSLSFISNQQLNSGDLSNKLLNCGLIIGGARLAFVGYKKYDDDSMYIRIKTKFLMQGFNPEYQKKEIIKHKNAQKRDIAVAAAGLIICGIGLYRSCK